MITRRDFLKISMAGGAATFLATRARFMQRAYAAQNLQVILPGTAIPQFVDPVPNLTDGEHLIIAGNDRIELEMCEHLAQVLPTGMPKTYTWSYLRPGQGSRNSYLGPVVLATRGQPTEMKFTNLLGHTMNTGVLAYKFSTDQTLHWADPLHGEMNMWNHMAMPPAPGDMGFENYMGPIPACVHLHGGEVPPELDGGPDAWFTSDGQFVGHGFYSRDGNSPRNYSIYRYPNSQEGALIWFHDHTLGATRLNVYAGLAGGYLIADPNDTRLINLLFSLPGEKLPELFPLVIQDRMFDTNGQLLFTAGSNGGILWALNPEHPYWNPEFVGDTILVNGRTWPYLNVDAKRYTFLLINGSNARTYELALTDPVSKNPGPALWVIGTDGGYLDKPVKLDPAIKGNNKLVMMPGERYWVIVDFAGYQGGVIGPNGLAYSGTWMLKNTARTPYPGGAVPNQNTTDRIMQFRVQGVPGADTSYNPATLVALRTPMVRLSSPQVKRQLTLNEVMGMPMPTAIDPVTGLPYPGGPLEILVNNTRWDGKRIAPTPPVDGMYQFETRSDFTQDQLGWNYLSELPQEGTTELWEIINLTADAHPIHLHLVQFQLLNRQNFDVAKYTVDYNAAFPGGGWDTMAMTPGPYPAGVFIPGFGPPKDYQSGNPAALGGNPDINAVNAKKRTLYLQSAPTPPLPQENGWKDTVVMYPGQVTRILVRWAPTDLPANTPANQASFPFDPRSGGQGYVWHCHIVDHEDNEMMRPDEVLPNAGAPRNYVRGTDF